MTTHWNTRWQMAALGIAIVTVLYLLGPALTPFVIAAIFAYLFNPFVHLLQRWRVPRSLAVSIVFALMVLLLVAILLVLVPFMQKQIVSFYTQLPLWINWVHKNAAPWLQEHFDVSLDWPDSQQLVDMLKEHLSQAGGIAAVVIAKVSKSGFALLGWIADLVIIPVVAFYLMRDWDELLAQIRELIPRSIEPVVTQLARDSDDVLSAFMRGQLSVMIALGVIYALGLKLVGIDVGPLIGVIAGLISFVPYLGSIVGVVMGVIAALVQYGDWQHVILVAGVFAVGNLLESYVLVPRLIGHKIGLHPVAVIFAILAGGQLFGFVGVLLALPVASVVMVLLRYLHQRYHASELYRVETPGAEEIGIVVVESMAHSVSAEQSAGNG
ncbi:AI-2E family transporter [Pseudolysobacter antarcticus]|uniref:AI-2E family transporter n=1 Tax=Pseudolysobacter antarcticus TaxID=2511995 RepID=A0A411HGP0_9GAMM|nr:AI-2E family transporter [Pseudolysobacter antarcticus]QBB69659.1 AI-2E family transporter [Pseudolysobacter antarcticus]